jgi:magnesium chelatase family protein
MEQCLSPVVSVPTRQNSAFLTRELRVEVSVLRGLQNLTLSGLPGEVLRDARDKIRAVLHNSVSWDPLERLVVHLSPQEIPKAGAHLELPITLACWIALQPQLRSDERVLARLKSHRFYGSVDLSGNISATPTSSSLENEDPFSVGARHFSSLAGLFSWIVSEAPLPPTQVEPPNSKQTLREVVPVEGRYVERLALVTAALCSEPILLVGPPGVGKTHLGKWCRSWYPSVQGPTESEKERIWRSAGYEAAPRVPFLNPHARTHVSEFLGYRRQNRSLPGLFSLAHGGLMVLDEFPELSRDVREIFRNVLDQKELRRFNGQEFTTWPADFWLVATANPCSCGQARPKDLSQCRCSRTQLAKYLERFSGPLLDRFGIQLFVNDIDSSNAARLVTSHEFQELRQFLDSRPEEISQRVVEGRRLLSLKTPSITNSRRKMKNQQLDLALSVLGISKKFRETWVEHFTLAFLNQKNFR